MRGRWIGIYVGGLLFMLMAGAALSHSSSPTSAAAAGQSATSAGSGDDSARALFEQGQRTFRFDTFGDEAFWGDTLGLHKAIEGAALGGVGPGVSPKTALAVGLKVDVDALPASLVDQIKAGQVNLDDPATTLALLKLNAV